MQPPTIAQVYTPEALATVFKQLLDENYTDVNRLWKGAEIVERGEYRWLNQCGRWAFVASNGRQEWLTDRGSCSCPDRQNRGVVCGHMAAAEMLRRLQTPEPTEPAPLTCPRCHKAPTSEISARAIRAGSECAACVSAMLFGDDDEAA